MSEEAGRELRAFIEQFGRVMDDALRRGNAGLSQSLREDMTALWQEVQRHVAVIEQQLFEVQRGNNPTLQNALDDAGLDGKPLRIKLARFQQALKSFDESQSESAKDIWRRLLDAMPSSVRDALASRLQWVRSKLRWGAKKRLFRSVLRWANPILQSLAAAIPPVAYVKEVKELVEAGVEEEMEKPDAPSGPIS